MTFVARLVLLASTIFVYASCDSGKVFEEYIEVENAIWKKENIASFQFDAIDTSSYHNLYINVRNNQDYAFSNLYLFVSIKGPDNKLILDTVNCELADKRGRWKGKGIGNLWDYKKPFLTHIKFAQKGIYTISYEQAMRVDNGLKGISDIGLRIEKR